MLAVFDDRLATMLDVLESTDPATPAWHFTPAAPKTWKETWKERSAERTRR